MPSSKRKQNGKKVKQKFETEMTLKEPISELDKEILTLRISESEVKLNRRMRLCSHMEEEMSTYKSLYSRKLSLKGESMKLLNEAFRDFTSESILLAQECHSMRSVLCHLTEKQHLCQKRVNRLSALAAELEANFLEYEKCHDEYPVFEEASAVLEEKVSAEDSVHSQRREDIQRQFDTCLLGIQNEVDLWTENVVSECGLRVDLLPLSQQALFQLTEVHLDSSSLETHPKENSFPKLMFPVPIGGREQVLSNRTHFVEEESHQLCLHLENQRAHQEARVRSMRRKMIDSEEAVQSSHLVQTVKRAAGIIRQQLLHVS